MGQLVQKLKFGLAQSSILGHAGLDMLEKKTDQFCIFRIIHTPEGGNDTACAGVKKTFSQTDHTLAEFVLPNACFTGAQYHQFSREALQVQVANI